MILGPEKSWKKGIYNIYWHIYTEYIPWQMLQELQFTIGDTCQVTAEAEWEAEERACKLQQGDLIIVVTILCWAAND